MWFAWPFFLSINKETQVILHVIQNKSSVWLRNIIATDNMNIQEIDTLNCWVIKHCKRNTT